MMKLQKRIVLVFLSLIVSILLSVAVPCVRASEAPRPTPSMDDGVRKGPLLRETTRSLGKVPEGAWTWPAEYGRDYVVSPNAAHIAYVTTLETDREAVVLDGNRQGVHEWVVALNFSPDSNRLAYVAGDGQEAVAAVDGQAAKFEGILELHFRFPVEAVLFSPDSRRWAHSAWRNGKPLVVIDGEESPPYEDIDFSTMTFSPDSDHFVYAASRDEKWFLVVDGEERHEVDYRIDDVVYSPDSAHLAYVGLSEENSFVVKDGQKGEVFGSVWPPVFSPNSSHMAYSALFMREAEAAEDQRTSFIVVDGQKSEAHQGSVIFPPAFSPDSNRLAYVQRHIGSDKIDYSLTLDGEESPRFYWLNPRSVTFSPHSAHYAYIAGRAEQDALAVMMIADGEACPSYDAVTIPVFSPDSSHLAYAAMKRQKWFVVVDGREEGPYEEVWNPYFYQDYESRVGFLRSDESPQKRVARAGAGNWRWSPVFSPDSKHLAYLAKKNGTWRVVVDGNAGQIGLSRVLSSPFFYSSNRLRLIGYQESSHEFVLLDVEINIPAEEAEGEVAAP